MVSPVIVPLLVKFVTVVVGFLTVSMPVVFPNVIVPVLLLYRLTASVVKADCWLLVVTLEADTVPVENVTADEAVRLEQVKLPLQTKLPEKVPLFPLIFDIYL